MLRYKRGVLEGPRHFSSLKHRSSVSDYRAFREKSLCVKAKAENHNQMPVTFNLSDGTACFCDGDHHMSSGIL